jgi:hypothetical protein
MMRERSTPKRQDDDQRGREAEAQAAMWLTQQGWRIVAERVKTKAGEIDLIAKRPGLAGSPASPKPPKSSPTNMPETARTSAST